METWFYITLLTLANVLAFISASNLTVGPPCYAGPDVSQMAASLSTTTNRHYSSYLQIFIDYTFPCSGTLVKWDYFIYGNLKTVYLDVWRWMPAPNNKLLQLVGSTTFTPKTSMLAAQVYKSVLSEYFAVEAGDMIGMHYETDDNLESFLSIPYLDEKNASEPSTTLRWALSQPDIDQLGGIVDSRKIQSEPNSTTILAPRRQPGIRAYLSPITLPQLTRNRTTTITTTRLLVTSPRLPTTTVGPASVTTIKADGSNSTSSSATTSTTTTSPHLQTKSQMTSNSPTNSQPAFPSISSTTSTGIKDPTTEQPAPPVESASEITVPEPTIPTGEETTAIGDATKQPESQQQGTTTTQSIIKEILNDALSFAKMTVNGTPVWVIVTICAALSGAIILTLLILLCYACCCRSRGKPGAPSARRYLGLMMVPAEVQTDYSADFSRPQTFDKATMTKRIQWDVLPPGRNNSNMQRPSSKQHQNTAGELKSNSQHQRRGNGAGQIVEILLHPSGKRIHNV